MVNISNIKKVNVWGKIKELLSDKKALTLLFLGLILTGLYYVVALDRGKTIDDYRGMILIVLLCDFVLVFLYKEFHCEYELIIVTIFILHTGMLIRNICNAENLWHGQAILLLSIISLIVGAFCVKYLDIFVFNQKINYIVMGATLAIYLLLRLINMPKNGAYCWVGPIQVTEIIKIIAILYFSYLFTSKKITGKRKILLASIYMCINIVGSLIINEMGSLLIMIIVYAIYFMMFVKSPKVIITYFSAIVISGLVLFGLTTVFMKGLTDRIIDRVNVWINPNIDPLGIGQQALKAKEAIILGGLFGTKQKIVVPEIETDYVFVGIAMKLGIVFCFLILIMFVIFLINGAVEYIKARTEFHSALIIGCIYYIFVQTIIMIGGSTGIIPMTGVTVPLISKGGTSLCITMMMIGIIIGTHYKNYDLEIQEDNDCIDIIEPVKEGKVHIMRKELGEDKKDVFCRSELGNRKENQDEIFVDTDLGIYAIFDGMGGGTKGGEASERLRELVEDRISKLIINDYEEEILIEKVQNIIKELSDDFYREYNKINFQYGATIAMAIDYNNKFLLFNAGDSRIYSLSNDTIRLETVDHNMAWIALRDGMSEEEVKKRKLSSRLLRYVGVENLTIDVHSISNNTKALLLATDGLYASLSDEEILDAFTNNGSAEEILNKLIDESLSRDGKDNTSGICLINR